MGRWRIGAGRYRNYCRFKYYCYLLLSLCSWCCFSEGITYISSDGDTVETGDPKVRSELGAVPIKVLYLPSNVDRKYGEAKDWADAHFPKHLFVDSYDSLAYREQAEHLAATMGLECITVSGDGKDSSYVREVATAKCVILEPTRLWDNDSRGWITNVCQRLRGKIVIARNHCADLEFRNTMNGFKVIAHPSAKFQLNRIYPDVDYIEHKSQ